LWLTWTYRCVVALPDASGAVDATGAEAAAAVVLGVAAGVVSAGSGVFAAVLAGGGAGFIAGGVLVAEGATVGVAGTGAFPVGAYFSTVFSKTRESGVAGTCPFSRE